MIVFKKSGKAAFGGKEFSHIECDVPDCGEASPPQSDLMTGKNLVERGWFIGVGKHRCPEHVNTETDSRGPLIRAADGSEGFVR